MPRYPGVDARLAAYDNPMKPVVSAMRDVILDADGRVTGDPRDAGGVGRRAQAPSKSQSA